MLIALILIFVEFEILIYFFHWLFFYFSLSNLEVQLIILNMTFLFKKNSLISWYTRTTVPMDFITIIQKYFKLCPIIYYTGIVLLIIIVIRYVLMLFIY